MLGKQKSENYVEVHQVGVYGPPSYKCLQGPDSLVVRALVRCGKERPQVQLLGWQPFNFENFRVFPNKEIPFLGEVWVLT